MTILFCIGAISGRATIEDEDRGTVGLVRGLPKDLVAPEPAIFAKPRPIGAEAEPPCSDDHDWSHGPTVPRSYACGGVWESRLK